MYVYFEWRVSNINTAENLLETPYNVKLSKLLASNGIHLTVYSLDQDVLPAMLMTDYYHLPVILDLNCSGSGHLLAQASQEKQFSSLHHWLLLSGETPSSEDPLITALEPLDLQIDSHVTISHLGSNLKQVLLQDVYRIGRQEPLIITPPRDWSSGQHFSSGPRRNNYNGINLKTSVLVMDDTWDTYLDVHYKHFNTEAKVHYMLMAYISEMLNFRMNVTLTDTWGYPLNGSSCFSGVVGTLQCGECEISAAGVMWKVERMDIIDYIAETTKFRGAYMFLKPSLSEVSIIYELPFSTSVWATYILTVAFLTVVLVIVQRIEKNVWPLTVPPDHPISWSDAVLDAVGIVCQQGSENVPKNLASRMVFIFMMLLSLFLLTSYSAIIVSLIQTTSSAISTLEDLMQSPMKLSMSDKLVNEITDPAVEKLFKEKLYTQPFREAFITEEAGMERIRRGLNAFHGLSGAYKIISDTYEEHEKCRYKEIKMFEANHVGFPIRKGSPYIEHMRQSTQWMKEAGMVGREEARWYYPKPRCESNGQNFVSVGIQDFYPALVILAYGILLSIIILVAEVLYKKHRNAPLETRHELRTKKKRNGRNLQIH